MPIAREEQFHHRWPQAANCVSIQSGELTGVRINAVVDRVERPTLRILARYDLTKVFGPRNDDGRCLRHGTGSAG